MGPLSDEQRVFTNCVEDILSSTPGLSYALLRTPEEIASRDPSVYALFLVETNPVHDLVLAIELAERAFIVRINGMSFARKRGLGTRFEWWIERRCRELERLVDGDLKLVKQQILTMPISATLEAGNEKKWHRIGKRENGWMAFMSFLLPYGFLLSGESKTIYDDWFNVE